MAEHHIPCIKDCFQNIGKNIKQLCRGNQPLFDGLLRWANGAGREQREAVLTYILSSTALQARPVLPMPELDQGKLSFFEVVALLEDLLSSPSGGVYEQFTVAAFVQAVIEEFDLNRLGAWRVETKNINASDASSRTPGDVQVKRGDRVEESFEVTAADWTSKLRSAVTAVRDYDLPRAHIVAPVDPRTISSAVGLRGAGADLSVLDVRGLLHTITAVMRKPARGNALRRLYEFLDRYHSDPERVNAYVKLLELRGLAVHRAQGS
jgi:hypothetical protein